MKVNGGMALTSVLLIAAGSALSRGALAAEPAVPAEAEEHGGVNISGEIEAGFRAFIERPPSYALPGILPAGPPTAAGTSTDPLMGGQPSPIFNTDRDNRAKFEEYGNISPGLFLEKIDISAQTKDGDYFADFRGDNVGNNNQRFVFDWSKAGEFYGTYSWDQIPHLYSASAQSIWEGVGTNFLTTPVWVGNIANSGLASNTAIYNALQGNLKTIDIGIERDKFAAMQRWTPNQNWDVRADYSHERREGTQVAGAIIGGMGAQQMVQLPAPVADTTQNAKLSGQYADETPWGGKFNVRTSASVSSYQNDFDSFTFENPFSATNPGSSPNCALTTANNTYPRCGRVSLSPDNQAYNFATTAGVDLPGKSRYMGTVSYTMMRQDDAFIDRTINPNPALGIGTMPTDSADAKVDTLLVNNVVSTRLGKDVKSTLRYRYYDNNNNTPEIYWPQYVQEDASNVALRRRNLAYSYTKQNASEELTWRPSRNLTIGGAVGWEQYDRGRRSVDVTNEFSGKVFLDARLGDDTRLRSSYLYAGRTYNNYDLASVAYYQYDGVDTTVNNLLMRKFTMADRNRQKANVLLEWSGIERLTITPTAGLRFDDYETNPFNIYQNYGTGQTGELGLTKDNSWNVGIEVAYSFAPGTTLMLAYVHENFDRDLYGSQGTMSYQDPTVMSPGVGYFFSNMDENVDTYIASANVELIPDKLELKLNYAYAHGKENWTAQPYTDSSQCLAAVNSACQPFPTVKNDYQRLDAILKYHVDPEFVTKVGLVGDVYVKLRYSWEQNQVTNWQNDWTTPYMYLVDGNMVRNISMAAYNPNYTSHLIAASLAVKW